MATDDSRTMKNKICELKIGLCIFSDGISLGVTIRVLFSN